MKFFLLDGSGFLYRAYYAFPPLTDSGGRNVNVVYGFFRMVMKILAEKPDYFMIAWDSPVKTHRHEAYPEYKANRKKMEDDFKDQIPLVKGIVAQLGLPSVVAPGYEADDILASLTVKYQHESRLDLHIYSGDKDLKQLLGAHVFCIDPMKNEITTPQSFFQEFGFPPHHIVDYLSLIGDSSDNVKGVTGIGPKRAIDLVKQYGDLDQIYANIDVLSPDVREKLVLGKEDAYQSKSLISLHIVPDIVQDSLDCFALRMDFDQWKRVLVHEHHFSSMEKAIDEIKKKFTLPTQASLFG